VLKIENENFDAVRKNHSIFKDFNELYAQNPSG
jgi:hypothetical protein